MTDFELQCEKMRETNGKLLALFEEELKAAELAPKTIRKHINNVDLFINDYLLSEEVYPMEAGVSKLDSFMGSFFIRKCMWSTPATVKSMGASIKKFYKCMLGHNLIPEADYAYVCSEIKWRMEFWQDDCAIYNGDDWY